jgi:glycosyltransferase involved in cell wall biosynthesis
MAPAVRQASSLTALGIDVTLLEVKGTRVLKYFQALPRLFAHSRSVEVIHAHYGFCGWLARGKLGSPVVVSFMGDDLLGTPDAEGRIQAWSQISVNMNRRLARIVDAVIVKSDEMAQVVAPVHAHVVPNGVDLNAFRPTDPIDARAALGWHAGRRYILFPGNPHEPRKGFRLARAAVSIASERASEEFELVPIWGVEPNRVPLMMNAANALLMTSYIEGSPNSVKEAMACNVPVVSVAVGDVQHLLSGVNGSAVCVRDAEALGTALLAVTATGTRSNGRDVLRSKQLDLESVARKIMSIYEDVLSKGG